MTVSATAGALLDSGAALALPISPVKRGTPAVGAGAEILPQPLRLTEQLREQGSSAFEFLATVEKYFKSAYVFGNPIVFLGPEKFAEHLKGLQHHRGLLLNVLFTQDLAPNPQRMSSPSSH